MEKKIESELLSSDESSVGFYDGSSSIQVVKRVNTDQAIIEGRLLDMDRNTLIANLRSLNLNLNLCGSITSLRKRLKKHYHSQKIPPSSLKYKNKVYPYYVVVDFEATCDQTNFLDFPHEIIEFPAILVDSQKGCVVDEFHYYVKPKLKPKLSEFCTDLTGIEQETVDNADNFTVVFEKFELWLAKHKLGVNHKYAFVTDSPCDLGRFLRLQCEMSEIEFPRYAKKWVNLRKTFCRFYKSRKLRLPDMVQAVGLQFDGRLHSGLDDSRNLARVLITMINDGASVLINDSSNKARLYKTNKLNGQLNRNDTNAQRRPEKTPTKEDFNVTKVANLTEV